MSPEDALFDRLAGTWRIVLGEPCRVRGLGDDRQLFWRLAPRPRARRRARRGDERVSVPLDSVIFLLVAFGSLEFIEGQIVVKYAVSVIFGIPLVLVLRRFVQPPG